MVPKRIRRFVENLLPWFDPAVEAQRAERTEAIRRRSISARVNAEQVRAAYVQAARELRRG